VEIGAHCQVGPGVFIEKNAQIGNDVHLENTVVLRDTSIAEGTRLKDRVVY
jgi:UDP-3-O-[3-hydroxymyristoyl] glucosamine N-acyltransferase